MAEHQITDWIGREETTQGRVGETMARMMTATLADTGQGPLAQGEVLPPLWHWTGFPPETPISGLGDDGHPKLGGFLPPVELPRRMWAGGTVAFEKPLHVGERLTRHSVIENVVRKDGRAGPMVFVTVLHEVSGEDGLALREQHDIVYLELPKTYAPPPPVAPPEDIIAEREFAMSNTLLFRFSACTFNSHRIHLDLDYVREVEKYPIWSCTARFRRCSWRVSQWRSKADPRHFRYRGVHPMFPDAPMRVLAQQGEGGSLKLCTARGRSIRA